MIEVGASSTGDESDAAAGERQRRRVTSVDVAIESGFSQATVARAFSSPHLVSEPTRERITAVAASLGYVPNAIARSLKSQRTNIVGAVVPASGEYWQHVLTAFSRQLAERGKQLLLFSFDDEPDDSVFTAVDQYRLDGLIMASARIGQRHLARSASSDVPAVAFNQPVASGVVPSVSVDNEDGTAVLATHLLQQGVESVMFVGGVSTTSTDQQRYRGAAQTLGASGVAVPYLEAGSFSYDDGYKTAAHIAQMPDRPDAIMVSGDELAFGVVDGLRSSGLDVPTDLLVTGFDGLPQASWAGYDLTTLVQSVDVLVERAIDLLLAAERPQQPPTIVEPGTLRIGRTTQRTNG
jgi:DNA-binding LacI/PurR family transcriptional regulator